MKQITLWVVILLGCITINAQNIELSFANAQITNDGTDDFYEVDVMITSDVAYIQGSGQFFLDYNTTAFGTLINGSGGIAFERTETSILGGQTTVEVAPGLEIPLGAHYNSFFINDATDSKVSFIWQQNGSGGMIGTNIPANTPTVLVHVKMKYLMGATGETPDLCFDATNPFDDQFFTACGPFDPLVGFTFVNADCINQLGSQIFDYTPDCTVPPTVLCTGLAVTTYRGDVIGWDNGIPNGTMNAVIDGDYNTATEGADIVACSCTINAGVVVNITAGQHIQTTGDLIVDGTLNVAHEGSVIQTDESAITMNNGSISISKTTPTLDPRDFIILSSPMSMETRSGVYSTADRAFEILPEEFTPNTDPTITGLNFLDEDGNYFSPATNLNIGQGYLVFPQAVTASSSINYAHSYTQGTLNSGIITVPLTYNGPATENNFNVVGNPYASAIDTDLLIMNNPAINEVYFWEHITVPNENLPGFGNANFSMDDISIRNLTGGVVAPNGGTIPGQYMASGQGFGVLAQQTAAGTDLSFSNALRVTGNNNTLRTPELENRLWLRLESQTYTTTSKTLIGFLPNASADFDPGYDSDRLATTFNLFSTLENGQQLAIQAREIFDPEIEIALGFETSIPELETYTISIDRWEGEAMETTPVFLIDHLLNTITNLKEDTYSFTAISSIDENRFALVFKDQLLDLTDTSFRESDITLYPNPASNQITLGYAGSQSLTQVRITDLNGKRIKQIDLNQFNGSVQIDLSTIKSGMYFVQIQSTTNTIVKKIIVE